MSPVDPSALPGLQAERTALAWERTAVAMMVAGVVLARYAAAEAGVVVASIGLAQTVLGAGVLLWAGWHYGELHGPIADGGDVVHPNAARIVGWATIVFSTLSLGLAVAVTIWG